MATPIDYKDLMKSASWGVDKSKIMTDKDDAVGKSYGRAIYLEFRERENTNQMVFISEAISPKTKAVVPMTMLQRQVSRDHDRRPWRTRNARGKIGTAKTALTFQEKNIDDTIAAIADPLEGFVTFFDAMLNGDWQLYERPLVVEISAEDVVKVEERGTPAALIRRILRAREDAGFSETIFN